MTADAKTEIQLHYHRGAKACTVILFGKDAMKIAKREKTFASEKWYILSSGMPYCIVPFNKNLIKLASKVPDTTLNLNGYNAFSIVKYKNEMFAAALLALALIDLLILI